MKTLGIKDLGCDYTHNYSSQVDSGHPDGLKDRAALQAYKLRMETQNKMKKLIEVTCTAALY